MGVVIFRLLRPAALGDEFEGIERKIFGGDGFDIYVDKVAGIEKQLGIYDLTQFTSK